MGPVYEKQNGHRADHKGGSGEAAKQELLEVVHADGVGYQDVESFWSNPIGGREALSRLPGVEAPGAGGRTWGYVDR